MSKNLNIRAQKVTDEIFDIIGMRPSGTQGEKVAHAIEHVIVKALEKSVERSTDAAMEFCATDRVMGEKIAEGIRNANKALIVNLTAMR